MPVVTTSGDQSNPRHCKERKRRAIQPISSGAFLDCFAEPSSGGFARTRWLTMTVSAAPDRWHGDLIERAGLLVDFRAVAEFQILAQADAHFAEPLAVAGDGNP